MTAWDGYRAYITWVDEVSAMNRAEMDKKQLERDAIGGIIDDALLRPIEHFPVASVRWVCDAPTAPLYVTGTAGWMRQQSLSRVTPAEWEYNRKLSEKMDAKGAAISELLGVKSNDRNYP